MLGEELVKLGPETIECSVFDELTFPAVIDFGGTTQKPDIVLSRIHDGGTGPDRT